MLQVPIYDVFILSVIIAKYLGHIILGSFDIDYEDRPWNLMPKNSNGLENMTLMTIIVWLIIFLSSLIL